MNDSTALARLVVERLIANGVHDVVLSPGSRSAPIALALAAAARSNAVRLHVRIDERSAAFLALGIAKASGAPVAVVCTSGSAVANLAPAIVEATYAGVPLIAITADRPPELRNVGANQTIDQVGFFGQQVRSSVDLLAPSHRSRPGATERKIVDRLVLDAIGSDLDGPAPVQLNIGFREPLVPDATDVRFEAPEPSVAVSVKDSKRIREPINYIVGDLGLAEVPARGVVVVGDVADPDVSVQAIELAVACGWPIISEPSGNALAGPTAVPAASVFLAEDRFRAGHQPALVLTVGRFGLSRPIVRLVGGAEVHVAVHVGGRDRPDPLRSAAMVLGGVPRPPETDPLIPLAAHDAQWLRDWIMASDAAQACLDEVLDAPMLTGLAVTKMCWDGATADDAVFVAASRSVRNLEAVMTVRQFAPMVLGNRGTSGIDGLVSTAWGIALARDQQQRTGRTIAILGDLAFLHDHNGLLAPKSEPRPRLTIVVADNNGGGIFSTLEQGAPEFATDFEQIFGTPHNQDLAAIAAATGHHTVVVTAVAELAEELDQPVDGVKIIIARTAGRLDEQKQWQSVLKVT